MEKADLSNLDVSQQTDFSYIFGGDANLKEIIGLDQWQVKDVTTFKNAFANCSSLEKVTGIGNWVSDKTIDLSNMFINDSSLQSIDSVKNWNTSNINNIGFSDMFESDSKLEELDVSNWQIKGGADVDILITGPFSDCENLNLIANGVFADYLVQFNKKQLSDNGYQDNGTVSFLKESYLAMGSLGGHLTTSNWELANAMKETDDPEPVPDDKKTTYTRTINYVYPEGYTGTKAASKTQTVTAVQKPIQVTFDRLDADEDAFDKVNPNKTVWSDDLKDSKDETKAAQFDEVAVPETSDLVAFEDDKQVSSVPSAAITKDTPDKQTVTITFKQKQSINIKFVDDDENGKQVGNPIKESGLAGTPVNFNLSTPENYQLAEGQTLPNSYTFKATDNKDITIHLKHQIEDVTNDKTNKDPNTNRAYYDMCHVDREYKIVDKMPTPESNPTKYGNDKELLDWHLEFYRQATRDKVTGKVTYGVWKAKNGDGKEFLLNKPTDEHSPWNSSDNTSATNGIISKQVSIEGIDGYGVIGTGNPVSNPNAIATFEGAPRGGGVTISANIAATQDELDNDAKGLTNGVLPSKTFYVEHVPLDQNVTVNFVDDDKQGNHVSDTQKSGKTDLHIEFTGKNALTIPSGYELAKNQPTGYTFNAQKDQQLTIHLVHKKDNVDKDHVPAGHTSDEFTKQIKRIIFAQIPNSTPKNLSQTISVDKTGVYDEVTHLISWNNWQNGTFAQVDAPQVDGYTPSQENVAEETPNSDEIESWVDTAHITTITYKANQQQTTAKFVDDDENGKQVGDLQTITGKTDENVPVLLTVPNNYQLAAGQMLPTGYKFKAKDNQPIVVHLVHQHSTPDGKEKDPNNDNKTVQELTHQEVKRTITINNPDKSRNDKSQKVTLTRTADKDLVTGKITYGKWNTSSFEEVDVPPIAGYTPSQDKVDSVASVDINYQDPNIVVNYTANDQIGKISYVDEDGHEVGKTDLSGKTDEEISINPVAPKGWKISAGQNIPTSEKAKADGIPTVTVKVEHNKTKVPHDQPKKPGDKTPTGKDIDGAHEKDLNQTITRTINVTDQHGQKTTTTQVAKIYRDAEVDDVTGEVTYGDWSKDDQHWSEFDVPTIPGYTASQAKVEKHTVEDGDKDQTINITYIPVSQPDDKPEDPTKKPEKDPNKKPDNKPNKKPHTTKHKTVKNHKNHKHRHYNENFGVHGQKMANWRSRKGYNYNGGPLSQMNSQNTSAKGQLPQTSESQNKLGLIGLAFAAIAGLIGLASDRKRKN